MNSPGINPGASIVQHIYERSSLRHWFYYTVHYADDTQIFYAGDNVTDVEQAITSDLGKIDKWYEENKMTRNHD